MGQRLKERRQRQVRAENEFYFQLLRDALPESALLEQVNYKFLFIFPSYIYIIYSTYGAEW